jgi:hypothetical protein
MYISPNRKLKQRYMFETNGSATCPGGGDGRENRGEVGRAAARRASWASIRAIPCSPRRAVAVGERGSFGPVCKREGGAGVEVTAARGCPVS